MTDWFLDRLGEQLVASERTLIADARVPVRRRRRWTTPRTLAIVLAGLIAGSSALAATQPWNPILGRPELRDTPAGTSTSPVPEDALAHLAVLRRPQTDRDRGPIVRKLLRGVGQQFRGVRLSSVRLVTLGPGQHALVLSAKGVGRVRSITKGLANPVCLVFGSGGLCASAQQLHTGDLLMTAGSSMRGLVPDGVATVIARFAGNRTISADVHDNVFSITGAPTTTRTVPAPPGSTQQRTPPTTSTARFTITWLDTNGRAIGPPQHTKR